MWNKTKAALSWLWEWTLVISLLTATLRIVWQLATHVGKVLPCSPVTWGTVVWFLSWTGLAIWAGIDIGLKYRKGDADEEDCY